MGAFQLNQEELLSFFAVLVRFSVLFSVLPFLGDRMVPTPVKVLLSLSVSVALYPFLVAKGFVKPGEAMVWASSTSGIVGTITLEALFGLAVGFAGRMVFEAVFFAGNLVGQFMGFGIASMYDPHLEAQSQVVAEFQMAMAMLVFLALDGHHIMLQAVTGSYAIVGVGGLGAVELGLGGAFSEKLIQISGEVVRFGVELAAPVAIALFAVNVAFGVMAKAMPQLNVLMLSFAASALIGLLVLMLSLPEFQAVTANMLGKVGESMEAVMRAMAKGT
ncbi:MAG: hypothetical protein A2X94_06775 [Bdellovibrionales bacterium GWB1_55_8]|nr:MAG: hypothetical protein A2X94_06775 [Bdellovibrionales bacterium GWB1_55_8]